MQIRTLFFVGVFVLFVTPITALAAPPTASSFSPADGAADIEQSTNLVITFSESVTATTTISSFVTIKRASDDSTVEAIDVSGSQISGSGSVTITINPSSDLLNQTAYYVQVDNDAFFNGTDEYYAGISDTTTWNFTTQGSSSRGLVMPPEPDINVQVRGTAATVRGSYSGGSVITSAVGFTYTNDDDTRTVSFSNAPSGFTHIVRDLECGQTYTFEAFAENSVGTARSNEVEITTEDCAEEVTVEAEAEETKTEPEEESGTTETSEEESTDSRNTLARLLLGQAPNDLSIGIFEASVMHLQTFLIAENTGSAAQELSTVGPTEYFGPLTRAALAEYQAAHGIAPALGYYGPITRGYIESTL